MDTKFSLEPGTMVFVESLLKKTGSKYFTHMKCRVENGILTDKVYAIPISYFMMEPSSFNVQQELDSIYQANHIPYMNKKFDRQMFFWLKDKMMCNMHITVVDNVIGPMNTNPEKMRPWAVWKWEVEFTIDEEPDTDPDFGYSREELDDMNRDAMNGDSSNSWNIDQYFINAS